ncbi:AAA family ATPase [Priestia aryabhattai]|uniref:AAA family ATPase n=1 Tax=Priestia aryabhattai TaxID=412384 RepID=UPI000C087D42|nr:SMC family ATPase [Priestia aryabhattai]
MKIKSIRVQAFRGFGKEYFVDLSEVDILLLCGPNGHGKTSMFDAIEWAITGVISRYSLEDSAERKNYRYIGNQFNQALQPMVELTIEDNHDKTIIIKRIGTASREDRTDDNRNSLSLKIIQKSGTTCYSEQEAESVLNDHLINENWKKKVNLKDSLSLTHLLGQERMNQFVRGMREKDRYDSLSAMFGTFRFNQLREVSREVEKELKQDKESLIQELDNISVETKGINREIEMLLAYHHQQFSDDILLQENKIGHKDFLEKRNLELHKYMGHFNKNINPSDFSEQQWIDIVKENQKEIELKKKELTELLLPKIDRTQTVLQEWKTLEPIYKEQVNRVEDFIELEQLIQSRQKCLWLYENHKSFLTQLQKKEKIQIELVQLRKQSEQYHEHSKNLLTVVQTVKTKTQINQFIDFKIGEYLTSITENDIVNKYLESDSELKKLVHVVESNYSDYKGLHTQVKEITSLHKTVNRARNKIVLLDKNYRDLLKTILKYSSDHPLLTECPACGSPQSSSFLKESVEKKQKELNPELSKIETELIKLEEKLKNKTDDLNTSKIQLESSVKEIISYLLFMENSVETIRSDINHHLKEIELKETELNQIHVSLREFTERAVAEGIFVHNSNIEKQIILKGQNLREKIDSFIKSLGLKTLDEWTDSQKEAKQLRLVTKEKEGILLSLASEHGYNQDVVDTKEIEFLLEHERSNILQMLEQLDKDEHWIERYIQMLIQTKNIVEYQKLENELKRKLKQRNQLNKKLELIEKKLSIVQKVQNNIPTAVSLLNKDVIDNLFETIRSIFMRINSHPIFRDITYETDERRNFNRLLLKVIAEGSKVSNNEDDSFIEVNPSYIYSAAQVNSIALSFFLAMSLQQKWSPLEFIAMDDPVQSMDDLNVLALVDLIRLLATSIGHQKQFIISTHDLEFQKLMIKKFRFLKIGVMNYIGYSEQGPNVSFRVIEPKKEEVGELLNILELATNTESNTESKNDS